MSTHPPLDLAARVILFAVATFSLTAQESLPSPWKNQDVGTAEVGKSAVVPGTAKLAGGVFTLQGTMDLWGPTDGLHFAWQPVQGDLVLVARVVSMDNPGKVNHAKASLTLRESLDAGSRCITQCVTFNDGTQFTYREATDGKTVRVFPADGAPSVSKGKFPCWLKLVRRGTEFSGYESLDGEAWWLTGTIKLDLPAAAFVGLASSSHTKNTLTTSVFDRVQLTGQPAVGAAKKSARK